MKKFEKKLNVAIVLSIVAIALSGTMFVLWCCNAGGFKAVDLDTFVGVIVALLAIIVTIAIGWQIWAAMDLKSNIEELDQRIKQAEDTNNKLAIQEQKMKQLHYDAQHFSQIALAETCKVRNDFVNAFRFYMSALNCALQLADPKNIQPMLDSMSECVKFIANSAPLSEAMRKDILKNNQFIRKAHLFGVIQSKYEQIYSEFKSKVKLNDDQK